MTPLLRRHRAAPAGFTLVEVMLSTAILAVILVALGSLMLLTGRGLTAGAQRSAGLTRAGDALDSLTLDASLARQFLERTATAATFVVPDRDGDGRDETIRYAWSGNAGDPLTRQVNYGAPAAIVDDVHAFRLDYLLKTIAPADEEDAEKGGPKWK